MDEIKISEYIHNQALAAKCSAELELAIMQNKLEVMQWHHEVEDELERCRVKMISLMEIMINSYDDLIKIDMESWVNPKMRDYIKKYLEQYKT